jgi:hypothetical protein
MLPTMRSAVLAAALLTLLLSLASDAPGWGGLKPGYSGPNYSGFGAAYLPSYGGVNVGGCNCRPVGWGPPSREAPPQGRVEGWRGAT